MTAFVLVFGVALLAAVLTSALASRSPLSTTTVFLLVGLLAGPLGLDVIDLSTSTVEHACEVALFAILFTDGQHAPWSVVRRSWRPTVRALTLGMPLTFLIVALLARVVGLDWPAALVLGAVLAPTDPVFASALVGRDDVPHRVRDTLNLESGLNDGLALPAVLVLVGTAGGHPEGWSTNPGLLIGEALVGVALGVLIPLAVLVVLRLPGVGALPELQPLGPLAVALIVFGCAAFVDANQFLAAFVAGATIATVRRSASESFRHTGELVSEMVKGAALLAFAGLLTADTFGAAGLRGIALALAVILVSRPLPIMVVLLGSALRVRERLAVAWFGPKGFASVAYAVIVSSSGMPDAEEVLALVAVVVLVSVVAHSSTDVAVAAALQSELPAKQESSG